MDTAEMAVTVAEAAVTKATKEKNQAIRTANSRPYMECVNAGVASARTSAQQITDTGTNLTDEVVTVVVTRERCEIYKGVASTSDVGNGWYRADATTVEVDEDGDPIIGGKPIIGKATVVYTDIEDAFSLFSVAHNAVY